MSLIIKLVFLYVVSVQGILIYCQQQDNLSPKGFFKNIKRILQIPEINFELPKRILPELRENRLSEKLTDPFTKFKLPFQKTQITTGNFMIQKYIETTLKPINVDCSDQIDLNCEVQRQLIKEIFKDLDTVSYYSTKDVSDSGKKSNIGCTTETNCGQISNIGDTTDTNNSQISSGDTTEAEITTTDGSTDLPDEGIASRTSPEIVAALVG